MKMNLSNVQTAFDYALYMIATSYFKKAKCKNKIREQQMLIQYKEQKNEKQYLLEDICIKHIEKLYRKIPGEFLNSEVEVSFRTTRYYTGVIIRNDKYILELSGLCKGKGADFDECLWIRKDSQDM